MESKYIVRALAALAQESRLAIYRLLVETGPTGMSAGKIGEALGIPNATLSFHLKELAGADLAVARQEGRFVFYTANFDRMHAVLDYLSANCCGGTPCPPAPLASCTSCSDTQPLTD